jgi:circadian clock protein KaiC
MRLMKKKQQKKTSRKSEPPAQPARRLETGVPRLDYILKGGLFTGATYVLMGPPGSGKTVLANHICYFHVGKAGGRCVYVTLLVESHTRMLAHLSSLEFFRAEYVPDRMFYVSGYSALREQGLDGLLSLIRRTLREKQATMLVIDGLESISEAAPTGQAFRELVHDLSGLAGLTECTTLLLTNLRDRGHPENGLVDGVLELSDSMIGPRAIRELLVHKFRGGDYLRGRHEVEIQSQGMSIHPRTEIQFDKPPESATEDRMTGTELVAAARKDPRIDSVPIVLMSAVGDPKLKSGVAGFLKKPFALSRLLAMIDDIVGR